MKRNQRIFAYFLVANVIGAFFLWLAVRDLPFDEILPYLRSADLQHVLVWSGIFVGIYAVCHAARVLRWNELVQPLGSPSPWDVHRASTVGFAAILLLPLRLGELVRPSLLATRTDLKVSSLLATAVVERVIDGLFVTGLLFVTLLTYDGGQATGFARTTGWIAAGIFVPAITCCALALWRRDLAVGLVDTLVRPVSETVADWITEILSDFIQGFEVLTDGGRLGNFLGITFIYWAVNIVSLWVLARFGFDLSIGIWDAATVIAILVIGIMIPAGPALTGNFELFLTKGLALFVALEAVGAKVAVFAALVHVLQFVVIVVPGFWVMWSDPATRHLIRISEDAREQIEDEDDG